MEKRLNMERELAERRKREQEQTTNCFLMRTTRKKKEIKDSVEESDVYFSTDSLPFVRSFTESEGDSICERLKNARISRFIRTNRANLIDVNY